MTIHPLGNMGALVLTLGPCVLASVCTSFAAYRLSNTNGFNLPVGYGNAITWGSIARANGYRVDMNPAVGSIAWFSAGVNGAGHMGHVAWVAEVRGDQVTIEEYNYDAGQGLRNITNVVSTRVKCLVISILKTSNRGSKWKSY